MKCPSCSSPLEQNARFCGVCGYRLQPARPAQGTARPVAQGSAGGSAAARSPAQKPRPVAKPRPKPDDIYVNQTLNNRFRIESKIGEGGFGAVYRGVQLATGRKVALKLLHPEMTKDENLVARFRREGEVLCTLRDAHTITTYDFDQTPDGTLYIAMELLEGKSLHQVFHDEAPLEWKRVFKILTEMCSSLAEAHAEGIVHRDLKPENIYLESRPGNPEFVKILDFGIAKVMRGDSIDPQAPQLTATGQTLGTLEYMSPEQLMGRQLDGRSDVYALGVVAYEMITGRLPFPDAKGPAGLITAQLKQTPPPPSQAYPKANLPAAADKVILKCLEKDKNNRYPDVSALSFALTEVVTHTSTELGILGASSSSQRMPSDMDLAETRRGEMPAGMVPPAIPYGQAGQTNPGGHGGHGAPFAVQSSPHGAPYAGQSAPGFMPIGASAHPGPHTPAGGVALTPTPYPHAPMPQPNFASPPPMAPYPQASVAQLPSHPTAASSSRWIWWVIGLLVLGAGAGAVLALIMRSS